MKWAQANKEKVTFLKRERSGLFQTGDVRNVLATLCRVEHSVSAGEERHLLSATGKTTNQCNPIPFL